MYCDSLLQCSHELSKLDAATRDNITWLHVVSYPFGWKMYKKESKALQDAGIFLSSEREVMNDSTWDKHENEMLLQSHAREVYYSDPRSIVVAQSDGCAAKLRWLGARLASPPQSVYDAFESRNNGKRGTARWLRAHRLGRFAIREFDVAQLWRNPANVTFPLMLKPHRTVGGHGIKIVHNRSEMLRAFRLHNSSKASAASSGAKAVEPFLVQEAVLGVEEWGVYFVAYKGALLHSICKRYVFDGDLFVRSGARGKGMQTSTAMPCTHAPFNDDHLRALINASRYHGFGCLGLKPRAGEGAPPALIEMNARIGASMLFLPKIFLHQVQLFAKRLREDAAPRRAEQAPLKRGPQQVKSSSGAGPGGAFARARRGRSLSGGWRD